MWNSSKFFGQGKTVNIDHYIKMLKKSRGCQSMSLSIKASCFFTQQCHTIHHSVDHQQDCGIWLDSLLTDLIQSWSCTFWLSSVWTTKKGLHEHHFDDNKTVKNVWHTSRNQNCNIYNVRIHALIWKWTKTVQNTVNYIKKFV